MGIVQMKVQVQFKGLLNSTQQPVGSHPQPGLGGSQIEKGQIKECTGHIFGL